MRVLLISDTHGDPTGWEKALSTIGNVNLVLHAGDVLYHGVFNPILDTYDPRRLAELLNSFPVPLIHARGNCDSEVDQMALQSHILSDFAFASIEGIKILITHGHRYSREEILKMAGGGKIDVVLEGHTHIPKIENATGVTFVNPGSPSLPKQERPARTAGLLEKGEIKIYDIDSGKVLLEGKAR
ncbi:MAG: phosphodiesterase [Actinomycetota bacterium]|nr:phosphodiesterase [Actinomycetota bacterium]